jgi:monoamine oxidase
MSTSNPTRLRFSRRSLLAGMAAAGAVSSLPRAVRAAEASEVIVIGAGLAGLYSALLLEEQGVKVTVLEANNRFGGRLYTPKAKDGVLIDVGGVTVGSFYGRVRNMVETLGVGYADERNTPPSAMANYINGKLVGMKDWVKSDANKTVGAERGIPPGALEFALFQKFNPIKTLEDWRSPELAAFDIPAGEFMRKNGVSDEAIRLMNYSSNVQDMWSSSALNTLRDVYRFQQDVEQGKARGMFDGGAGSNIIKTGSEMLPKAMAKKLKTEIRLNSPVTAIRHVDGGKKVEVTTQNQKTYKADYVVLALPLYALRRIDIDPPFEGPMADAVQNTVMSATTQIMFRIKDKFWEQDGLEPALYTDTIIERVFFRKTQSGEDILNLWVNGTGAENFDRIPENYAMQFALDLINRIRPSTKGKIEPILYYSWGNNPWVGGNRHVYNAGQVMRFAGAIGQVHHRLHMAGEHTRVSDPGMEAAMASAERVVTEILDRDG